MSAAKSARPVADPANELCHFRKLSQLLDRVEVPLELLLGQHFVNLRMARPANPDHLPHHCPVEIAFVLFIMMASSRDQMMPG